MKRRILCLLTFMSVLCTMSAQLSANRGQRNNSTVNEPDVFTVAYATSDDGFMNVRTAPSNSGAIIEKLWMQSHGLGNGVLLEKGNKWSKVSVGTVTGWVYNKYLGIQTWYDGTGSTILVAALDVTPIYGENYRGEGDLPIFTTVKKNTILADQFDEIEGYYILKTGHDYLFIKKSDAVVRNKNN